MDHRYDILSSLYGEAADREAVRARVRSSAAARREHDALAETKFCLDHRKRQRPSARVLQAVAAAAAEPLEAPRALRRRQDRAAMPPRLARLRRRALVPLAGAVFAVTALVGAGAWHLAPAPSAEPPLAQRPAAPAADLSAEQALPAAPPAPVSPAPALGTTTLQTYQVGQGAAPAPGVHTARREAPQALEWDVAPDARRLHQRVQQLKARAAADLPQQ